MVYCTNWVGLRDAKKHTIKAFLWFKGDLIYQWIPKFYLCDESNPINPQCGKISANFYISPPHPPHQQFYTQKWWKFRYTSKKLDHNRPARCAGQQKDQTSPMSKEFIPMETHLYGMDRIPYRLTCPASRYSNVGNGITPQIHPVSITPIKYLWLPKSLEILCLDPSCRDNNKI